MENVCEGPSTKGNFFRKEKEQGKRQEAWTFAWAWAGVQRGRGVCVPSKQSDKPGHKRKGHKHQLLEVLLNQEREKPEEKGNKNTKKGSGSHLHVNRHRTSTLSELQSLSNPSTTARTKATQQNPEDKIAL